MTCGKTKNLIGERARHDTMRGVQIQAEEVSVSYPMGTRGISACPEGTARGFTRFGHLCPLRVV